MPLPCDRTRFRVSPIAELLPADTSHVGTCSESLKHLTSNAFPVARCPIKIALIRRKPLILRTYVMFFWTHRKQLDVMTPTRPYGPCPIRSSSTGSFRRDRSLNQSEVRCHDALDPTQQLEAPTNRSSGKRTGHRRLFSLRPASQIWLHRRRARPESNPDQCRNDRTFDSLGRTTH